MTEARYELHACELCGDFAMIDRAMPNKTLCDECVVAITHMRSTWERRGGTLTVHDGKVTVRTRAQLAAGRRGLTDFSVEVE